MSPLGLHIPIYSPLLTGTKNARDLKRKWPKAVSAANLTEQVSSHKILVPHLSHIEISSPTGHEVSALVDMSTTGKTSRDLQRNIETVTSVLGAYQTRVEKISPAQSRITVYFERPNFRSPTNRDEDLLDLENFPIHLDPTDDAPLITLTTSLLIGGASESGKSNLTWYILSKLNEYQIPYRLHVIDPAGGVELADLENSPLTRQYVDRVGDIPRIIEKFRESMDKRLKSMRKAGRRRHFPTVAEPLEILIIDELILCKSQLKGGDADSPLGEILASGRKALHIVIGETQLGDKLVIGQIRDLFPQRICLRTRSSDNTDTVLGTNATVDGAMCHRITQKGEGYVFTDVSGVFERFHVPLVQDTQAVARGAYLAPPTAPPKTRKFW